MWNFKISFSYKVSLILDYLYFSLIITSFLFYFYSQKVPGYVKVNLDESPLTRWSQVVSPRKYQVYFNFLLSKPGMRQ